MANPPPTTQTPITPEAFMADRANMWSSFTSATTYTAAFLVVLLALMGIFLL